MPATIRERLEHILEATVNIRTLLAGKSIENLRTEPFTRAAPEKFIEIISEASRHVPSELRDRHPQIAWIDIANIGNRLRHGYDMVDESILWDIYAFDIDVLDQAVKRMKDEA